MTFNQASSNDAKNAAYARIAATRGFRQARRVDGELFTYLSHWYYPAIREMVARADFDEDPTWVARQLVPRIEVEQAADALALLIWLGLVQRSIDGRLERGDPRLTTGAEVTSLAVANYHGQMIERAAAAVEDLPPEVRDISAVTFCVRWHQVDALKERLAEFRAALVEEFDAEDDPDVVYQLNLQLFPLTRPRRKAA